MIKCCGCLNDAEGRRTNTNKKGTSYDVRIDIIFHALKNIEVPVSAKTAKKMNFAELEAMLMNAGFVNIRIIKKKYDLITGWITKDGTVDEISINGDTVFSENVAY